MKHIDMRKIERRAKMLKIEMNEDEHKLLKDVSEIFGVSEEIVAKTLLLEQLLKLKK